MKLVRFSLLLVVPIFVMVACGPATTGKSSTSTTSVLIDGKIEVLKVSQGLKEALRNTAARSRHARAPAVAAPMRAAA